MTTTERRRVARVLREAARIARDGLLPAVRDWDLGYNAALRAASAAIERAAGGEG